jgi:hypothetical protein
MLLSEGCYTCPRGASITIILSSLLPRGIPRPWRRRPPLRFAARYGSNFRTTGRCRAPRQDRARDPDGALAGAAFLRQAGVENDFVKLADQGIHGNGHFMMLEKNNLQIAAVIADWLARRVTPAEAQAERR